MVIRHAGYRTVDLRLQISEQARQVFFRHHFSEVVIMFRSHVLAQHHLYPGIHLKQVAVCLEYVAIVPEQGHTEFQEIGDSHGCAVLPERAVATSRRVIVENDKVANPFQLKLGLFVV
jgi:hypothetical protein